MNKVKKMVVLYFILCLSGCLAVEAVLVSAFDALMISQGTTKSVALLLVGAFFVMSLANIAGAAYIFYRLTGKIFQKENMRWLNERNMLYSCIAHDLKTPMTSVQGFVAALRERKVKPEEQKEIYDIIYSKSCYMNELLDTMFTYAKLNTDDFELTLREMDVCPLVRELVAFHYDEFEKRDMNLKIDIPEKSIVCNIDEKEIKRTVSNLLINACKHNENGAQILVRVSKQEDVARIMVADNGREITGEERRTIFEPFSKGDVARTGGNGTGLGLAIANLIVKKHGGKLYVDDRVEGWTKGFVVELLKG